MQITRRILCEGDVRREIGVVMTRIYWQAKKKSFGARLPFGGAVMVVTPSLCWWQGGPGDDRIPIAKDYIPLIGWTDNADDPTVVEVYIWPGYYAQPNARIRYHGMTARTIDLGSAYHEVDDGFGWFSYSRVEHRRVGFYAVDIPESEWSQIENVAQYLEGIQNPKFLPDELALTIRKTYSLPFSGTAFWSGDGAYGTPRPTAVGKKRFDSDQLAQNLANFYPLFWTPEGYEFKGALRGYLVADDHSIEQPMLGAGRFVKLKLNGEQFELRRPLSVAQPLYDPRTRHIYLVGSRYIPFPTTQQ